jgi:hypothetical protein
VSRGLTISVSIVIATINVALRTIISYLVVFEQHWTETDQGQSYAVMTFIAQLLNSALVLILINASPAAKATQGAAQDDVAFLTLSGQYDDFTSTWYSDVGLSVIVLIFIQILTPVINLVVDVCTKKAQQCWILRCKEAASQVRACAFSRRK